MCGPNSWATLQLDGHQTIKPWNCLHVLEALSIFFRTSSIALNTSAMCSIVRNQKIHQPGFPTEL